VEFIAVGTLARLAGVTVRTLHHYDDIGLLTPSGRSRAGYRSYDDADVERLQRILFYRELGFGLDEIKDVMTESGSDASVHLRRQHAMLRDRIGRLERMAVAVEKALEARTMGINLSAEDRLEVFGDFDPDQYTGEVEERWGETDAYRESMRRTRGYTKADWQRIKAEGQAAVETLVGAMRAGKPADAPEAMDGAELHRLQIDRNFYACSYEMQVGLAEMYLTDPRFTATYEKIEPGLAQYLHDAIVANAARHSG
jgi:DNA-binding transcriptional MerR regulator